MIPAGHVDCNPYVQIFDAIEGLMQEFREEIGNVATDSFSCKEIALFDSDDKKGLNVIYIINSNISYMEIENLWRKAKDRSEHQTPLQLKNKEVASGRKCKKEL